jgi:predicted Zn finger-like uncharacterized protein
MDVQCERCKTEYEFDDALVSGRGTTVRCTHCGHQFKVRRSDAGEAPADRWVVKTSVGQQLTFLTLRELQRAILAKQVARHDMLLLGAAAPRPLGSITELEPFFDGRASSRPPPATADTMGYHAPAPPIAPGRRHQWLDAPQEASLVAAAPPPPPAVEAQAVQAAPAPAFPIAPQEMSSPLPPPTVPVRRSVDDDLREMHSAFPPPSSEDAFDVPRRRRMGGWVVAFVLLLAVGVVGWVVAKPYLLAHPAADRTPLDARAHTFLSDGEKAMADGDLEGAQQDFDKASALAEHDPRVLLDDARVAAAKADIPWLRVLLLAADASEEVRTTKAQLVDAATRARKAADDALTAAPDDPAAVRATIDALRLQGDRAAARGYVPKVSGLASQPETAYVLAALDLAETTPLWTTVVDRLRLAAAGEGNAGRALSALVYALAKSGDVAGAKAEVAKLDALTRPYPCLPNLHAFVERALPRPAPERSATAPAPRADGSSAPAAKQPPSSIAGSGDAVPGEQASAMQVASQAIKRGDYTRARRIYETLAARNPTDSEALAGIGDVARAQGDTAGAIASYQRALSVNPSYLPALLGVADTEWASGDRARAQRSYKDIVDRFPEGTYPSHVKGRAEAAPPPTADPSPSSGTRPFDPGDGI